MPTCSHINSTDVKKAHNSQEQKPKLSLRVRSLSTDYPNKFSGNTNSFLTILMT